jgi:hypothetical protein
MPLRSRKALVRGGAGAERGDGDRHCDGRGELAGVQPEQQALVGPECVFDQTDQAIGDRERQGEVALPARSPSNPGETASGPRWIRTSGVYEITASADSAPPPSCSSAAADLL